MTTKALLNWQRLKEYLREQEVWYSVNYRGAEKHEVIVEVIEKMKEFENDSD